MGFNRLTKNESEKVVILTGSEGLLGQAIKEY